MQQRIPNIISFGNVAITISLAIIIIGFVAIFYLFGGLSLGIDFQSGVSMQVQFEQVPPPSAEEIRTALAADFGTINVQRISNIGGRYLIKSDLGQQGDNEVVNDLQRQLTDRFGEDNVQVLEIAFIGPRYSGSVARQSIVLTVSALALILVYIWVRFRFYYAVSAIIALIHDVLMTVVFLGITRTELSTSTVAAVLTIIGYSLNDTVVIFDRIRENSGGHTGNTQFPQIVNMSIRQSMSRTLITSLTTLLAVIAIYIFSTGSIRDFALSMIFGVIVGTYSSIYIASPVLVAWAKRAPRAVLGSRRKKSDAAGSELVAVEGGSNVPAVSSGGGDTAARARSGDQQQQAATVDTEHIKRQLIAQRQQRQKKKKR